MNQDFQVEEMRNDIMTQKHSRWSYSYFETREGSLKNAFIGFATAALLCHYWLTEYYSINLTTNVNMTQALQ